MVDLMVGVPAPPSGGSGSLRTRSGRCLECGREFRPSRKWHLHCSDACRAKGWKERQRALDFAPAPLPPVVDQRVPRAERRRLGGMSRRIIDLLRERGVVTNREWADLLPPGAAWRTRVSDARKWLERTSGETIRCRVQPGGLALYWIEAL